MHTNMLLYVYGWARRLRPTGAVLDVPAVSLVLTIMTILVLGVKQVRADGHVSQLLMYS